MVAGQVYIRIPATGHGQCAAVQMFAASVGTPDGDMAKATPAGTACDHGPGEKLGNVAFRGVGPRIDDRCHVDTRRREVGCRAMPVIIVGEDGDPIGRGGCPAVDIGPYGAGLHDAGPVVVVEGDQPFGRAGRQNRASGIDAPQDLARRSLGRGRQVIRDPLENPVNAVIEDADGGASGHQPHIRHGRQLAGDRLRPVSAALAADGFAFHRQAAAGAEILVDKDDPCAGPSRRQRGHQPGRPAADHK